MFLISLVIVIACLAIGLLFGYLNEEFDDDSFGFSEITLNVKENSKLVIKDNLIYDEVNQSEIRINEKYNSNYKIIGLYDYDKYFFIVFSNNLDSLVNNMYLVEHINVTTHNRLFVVSKEKGVGTVLQFSGSIDTFRLNLSSIKFIEEDIFIVDEYSYNKTNIRNLYCFKIISKDDLFTTLNTTLFFIDFESIEINDYLITSGSVIVEYNNDGNKDYLIYSIDPHFTYMTKNHDGETYIASSSSDFGRKNITKNYKDKEYLLLGYFAEVNNEIVYLDNDLTVKSLLDGKSINILESIDEFKTIYQS